MKDVDAHDEEDSALTEAAVATAVAAALAHPPDIQAMTAERAESILESVVGLSLRFYAQRVMQLFLTDLRARERYIDDEDYRVMSEAVDHGVRRAIDLTGDSVRDIVAASAGQASGPITIEDGLTHEQKAYRRLTTGMQSVSRILVTRTREEAKFNFASRMGAVGKAWRTRRDPRVRVTHGDLEGDFVGLDEAFVTVKGNRILRPGDPAAPLEETINCRCRLSYRMPARRELAA